MVADPEVTQFWSYFRIAGDPTGIVGDEDFSASHARGSHPPLIDSIC